MKFYGIECKGKLILQKVSTLPTFDATRDEGRLVYNEDDNSYYQGTNTKWEKIIFSDNNLSDLENAAIARSNLGLSDAATTTVSAIRSGTTKTDVGLGNVDNYSQSHYDGRYLLESNNLSDLANTTTARSNLGLSDAATTTVSAIRSGTTKTDVGLDSVDNYSRAHYDGRYLLESNNLSDLANTTTARSNLGLGNHVTHNYGTSASTVCQGNDSRLHASGLTGHSWANQDLRTNDNVTFNRVTTTESNYSMSVRTSQISADDPSGGKNGDVWYKY